MESGDSAADEASGESSHDPAAAVRCAFRDLESPSTPLDLAEVAERADCTSDRARRGLEALVEGDELASREVGAGTRVWWPASANESADRDATSDAADGTVDDGAEQEMVAVDDGAEQETVAVDDGAEQETVAVDDGAEQETVAVGDGAEAVDIEPIAAEVGEEFTAFVDAVRDYAIFMLDPDGVVVSWNEGARRIKGYEASEIVGEHFSTFYTEADRAADVPERNLAAAAEDGRVEDEGWRVRADGTEFWADVVVTAIRDDDGELQGYTKVTRDMTERREYRQRLRRERDFSERLLETSPVSICLVDADGEIRRANERMLERLGADGIEADAYDLGSWSLYDAEGGPIPADERPWRRALATGETVYDEEYRVELPGVGTRWLSLNAAPIEDEQHTEELVVLAVEDVTDRVEREHRLRREYEQTEQLLRTAPIAIAVQDAEGETVLANDRAQAELGLVERDLAGGRGDGDAPADAEAGDEAVSDAERAGGPTSPTEPDAAPAGDERTERRPTGSGAEWPVYDGEEWGVYDAAGDPIAADETPAARVVETGEPVTDRELLVDPPDGDRRQFRVNAAPLVGADGDVDRVVIAAEDITELKRREHQLERRKDELETELTEILGRISDAFYALDAECRFTHLNEQAAELMQRSSEDLVGQEVWTVVPDDREDVYREHYETAMETQEAVDFELYEEDFDAWFEFNVYPSESGLSIYFRDVTERKEYERRLEASNARLEQFAYAASHDLQEPLRMVSSYLQLLESRHGTDLDEAGEEYLEFAVDGADRMRAMIDGLLAYSRVETEGDPLTPVELEAVLGDVREDLQVRIRETDADVIVEDLPRVRGDASQLRQLFLNLLENALTYAGDEPPTVEVRAEREGDRVAVAVHDEGIGIPPEHREDVFEVFDRLHGREEYDGTGIGLALCQRIADRHGGEIVVDSEPGEYTTFTVTLPAVGGT